MLRYAPNPYRLTYERPPLNSASDCHQTDAKLPIDYEPQSYITQAASHPMLT
jgi:hypothetical protein